MGHLVNPVSFRLGISRFWSSTWSLSKIDLKYKYIMRSEWNIHLLLSRFFSRSFVSRAGIIYSHCFFVRSSKGLICNICFWDGLMLQTFIQDLNEIFLYLFNRFFVVKFLIVLNFFLNYYQQIFGFLEIFEILGQSYKLNISILKNFIYFFMILLIKKISLTKSLNKKFFYIVFFFISKFLQNKISLALKVKRIIFGFKCFLYFFFFFIRKFFFDIGGNLIFIDNISINIRNNVISNNNIILFFQYYLRFFFEFFFSQGKNMNTKIQLLFNPISHLDITSSFIARYLATRMKQRYRLMQALGPVLHNLRRTDMVSGYRISASGRFTKKEIAAYQWFRFGSSSTSTFSTKLDFFIMPFILKYSLCCFKVWINLTNENIDLSQIADYFYKDLLTQDFFFFNFKYTHHLKRFFRNYHLKNFFFFFNINEKGYNFYNFKRQIFFFFQKRYKNFFKHFFNKSFYIVDKKILNWNFSGFLMHRKEFKKGLSVLAPTKFLKQKRFRFENKRKKFKFLNKFKNLNFGKFRMKRQLKNR